MLKTLAETVTPSERAIEVGCCELTESGRYTHTSRQVRLICCKVGEYRRPDVVGEGLVKWLEFIQGIGDYTGTYQCLTLASHRSWYRVKDFCELT